MSARTPNTAAIFKGLADALSAASDQAKANADRLMALVDAERDHLIAAYVAMATDNLRWAAQHLRRLRFGWDGQGVLPLAFGPTAQQADQNITTALDLLTRLEAAAQKADQSVLEPIFRDFFAEEEVPA